MPRQRDVRAEPRRNRAQDRHIAEGSGSLRDHAVGAQALCQYDTHHDDDRR